MKWNFSIQNNGLMSKIKQPNKNWINDHNFNKDLTFKIMEKKKYRKTNVPFNCQQPWLLGFRYPLPWLIDDTSCLIESSSQSHRVLVESWSENRVVLVECWSTAWKFECLFWASVERWLRSQKRWVIRISKRYFNTRRGRLDFTPWLNEDSMAQRGWLGEAP